MLEANEETGRWKTQVLAHEFKGDEEEILIRGRQGFFDYFTPTFDGKRALVELIPNDTLPAR